MKFVLLDLNRLSVPRTLNKAVTMPDGLDKSLKILPHYLKEAGYSAHMVGKWHLGQGHEYDMPWNKGFDSFLGFLGTN